ncbi:MAG: protein kinase, partial [Nannocystaceae bacterium]|nr:protein kinase [Nannocystaceae bacterium]
MDSERDADTEQAERVRAAGEAEPAAQLDRSRAAVRAALFGREAAPLRIGRYVVLATLGQGGMGVVYRAWDPELDRNVALKLVQLDGRASRTARARARLLREGQAMAKLAHPNVVPVFDAGAVGDDVFIAMEHVDGVTLREWLRRGPPSRREILRVMIEAGRGLAAAHRAGVVHRDFKPANVLVGRDGRARVLDFGLARALEQPESSSESEFPRASRGRDEAEITELGQVVGTPAYIAPERIGGVAGDERADQYAFGVTLYEALAGRHPFPAPPGVELRAFLATAPLQPPPRIAGVPARLQRTVARLLAAEPAARFASMDAVIAELARDPWARLRRAAVVVLASALVLLLGLQLWSLSRPGHVRPVVTAAGQAIVPAALEVDGEAMVPARDGTLSLSPGLHRIAATLPDHRRAEAIVEVVRGATLELPLVLEHEQGLLEIDVEPRGATIVIDGVEHGSPLRGHRVDTGHHTLWVRQLGWYERALEVDVAADQRARAYASLSPGLVWSEPETGVNGELLWLGDADGDGRPELAHRNFNRVRAFDPWHGRRVWSVSFGNNQGERTAWGDLDGDGVQDLVVAWHVDAQRVLAAWSGRSAGDDPVPRWRREHALRDAAAAPLPGPLVLPLLGDARPELLLAGRTGHSVEMLAGDDGRTLATLALADAPLGLAALPPGATPAAVVLDGRALWG